MGTDDAGFDDATIRAALKSQYYAALAMLREAIELCPDELWVEETPRNAYWQIAYHVLFFAHLYLLDGPGEFVGWEGHQADVQHPDGIAGPADPDSALPLIPRPYTRSQVLAYWALCASMVDERIDAMDLRSPTSGFHWYPISKLEHQLVNIRHIQHHTAQLADRLRAARDIGVKWVGAGPGGTQTGVHEA